MRGSDYVMLLERPNSRQDDDSVPSFSSSGDLDLPIAAPVEEVNPLGRNVGVISAVSLNLSMLLGMGIYSTPGVVLDSVGSVGMSLVLWIFGSLPCFAGLALYNELASLFPKRSGGQVVFLEQAYPRPRLFLSTVFAFSTVMLSVSALNAIVFAHYTLFAFGLPVTPFRQRSIAVAHVTFVAMICGVSTRWSLKLVNIFVMVKFLQAFLVIGTGCMVLLGIIRVPNSGDNFRDMFAGTSWSANAIILAMLKVDYTYSGWDHVIKLFAEVQGSSTTNVRGQRSRSPIQIVRLAGYLSLAVAGTVFLLVNLAYFSVVPKETLRKSGTVVAAVFFETAYGNDSIIANRIFPGMIMLSCVGVTISSTLGVARVVREIARQGILPYPEFWSSTHPFGTPLPPILMKYVLSVIVIVAPPAEDAFNFLLDLAMYPGLVFHTLVAIGVWIIRKRRAKEKLSPSPYQASNILVMVYLTKSICTLIIPWIPPEKGSGDVSMWYATYCVVGLGVILVSAIYYYVWIQLLPRLGGYVLVQEVVELPGGGLTNRLVRKKLRPSLEGPPGGVRRRVRAVQDDQDQSEEEPLLLPPAQNPA